jgi:ribonuclease HI
MSDAVTIHIDGASRGNPGPAAFAYTIAGPGGEVVEHAEVLDPTTNNVAEYTALLRALAAAAERGYGTLHIFSDSELMVKQVNGLYRVKNEQLKPLYEQACRLIDGFGSVTLRHVRREQNKRADELCNLALDGKLGGAAVGVPKAKPKTAVGDAPVRAEAVECLANAARAWRAGDRLRPEDVWEQLWSILEEAGVLRKGK